MNFSIALQNLKEGHRVCRSGWNGKGMWLFLVDNWQFNIEDYKFLRGFVWVTYPFIAMKTADNKIVPWLASQTDILAEDWEVI